MPAKTLHVYLLASRTRVLYVGVTSDLTKRMAQHKEKAFPGFTARYNVDRLVYCEETGDALAAIAREKQIKGWVRAKEVALIKAENPEWRDLSEA
ncbi:MAG: GIY-YIG nuclease family protein [Pseudomonadota bacterium]|nr:GIY-YIG nuclease family protein [Pseudomonadota bacterium]